MCGIFSAVTLSAPFVQEDKEKFTALTNLVNYRGPDSSNYQTISWHSYNDSKFDIFLGHRRLSIIDLSEEGSQPMCFDNISIIFNGEIFNYIELKVELEKEGVVFKTKSDTEVIIRLYAIYGEKSFAKLNGMWALILFDGNKNKIVASRDRFSIKPLFLYQHNNRFFFASELKQLLPLLPKKEINETAVYKFLLQNVTDYDDNTFFKGIRRLKPKTNFIININELKISEESYWDYNLTEDGSTRDLYEEFRYLLHDSVRIRLRSDVAVGTLLSGGLDSSAITIIADKLYPQKLETYSIVSHDKRYSEEEFVDFLINEKNIKNTKLYIDENVILNNLEKTIDTQDEPFGTFSVIAQYTIFELIKKNSDIKVVLSGQGGDEILMGYRKFYYFYLKDLLKNHNYTKFVSEIKGSLINRTVLSQFQLNLATRYLPFMHNTNRNFILLQGDKEPLWRFDTISARQMMDIDKYSVPQINRFEDRNSMAHSIETRTPFSDHRLVNFALSLPTEYKIQNGWTKFILRKTITDLPSRIAWRRDKKSFIIPEERWLRNELKSEIYNTFEKSKLGQMGIIDTDKFLNYYKSFLKGSYSIHHSDLSKVYIAEKWCQKHFN